MNRGSRDNERSNVKRRQTLALFCLGGVLFYCVGFLQNALIDAETSTAFDFLIIFPSVAFGGLFILGVEWVLRKIKSEIAGAISCAVLIPLLIAVSFFGGSVTNFVRIFLLTFTWLGLYVLSRKSYSEKLFGPQSMK